MAKKNSVYVDTSALIAFLDRSDSFHTLFAQLFSNPAVLVTTPLVINEGHAWFLRRYDAYRAFQFLSFIEDLSPLTIASVSGKDIRMAGTLMRKFSDQSLTVTDAVGLALMQDWKIKICWTTDRHLGLLGASVVIHEMK